MISLSTPLANLVVIIICLIPFSFAVRGLVMKARRIRELRKAAKNTKKDPLQPPGGSMN
jgi:hypothetical protein